MKTSQRAVIALAGILVLLAVLFPPRRYVNSRSSDLRPPRSVVFADGFDREYDESRAKEHPDGTSVEFFRRIEIDWPNQATQLGLVLGVALFTVGIIGMKGPREPRR